MAEKWFRMQDGPPLPWDVGIAIYRGLYEKLFSSQSAETIHHRGGGGYDEIKHMAQKFYDREQKREADFRAASAPAQREGKP
jgi:hypothetical protein